MPNTLEQNFNIAAKLAPKASAKIEATLRCLKDNGTTKIDLVDPQVGGGRTVSFILVKGNIGDLKDCCGLRDVTIDGNTLRA